MKKNSRMIFQPALPLNEAIAAVEAKRQDKTDPLAALYAGEDFYKKVYQEARRRLKESDIVEVGDIAAHLSMTPEAYVKKAKSGHAVLIEFEGRKYVPLWSLDGAGKIDPLKCDIAREFAEEGKNYFKFIDYLDAMTKEKIDISGTVPKQALKTLFSQAGYGDFDCTLSVEATPNQLCDRRNDNPAYLRILVDYLDRRLTHGGWDPSGGLSRSFRNKYKISGQTIDEQRAGATPKAPRP